MVEVEKTSLRRTRRWLAGGVVGLFPLVAACSSGADADESQPTVFEGDSSQQDNEQAEAVPERTDESDDSLNGDELDEDETPEPVPASSEGPAENWPEPEIPDEIYEPTEEGAEALIQYWFDARHHARITGDVEVLEYVSLAECELCAAEIEAIAEVYPEGWFFEEAPDEVHDAYTRLEADNLASGLFELRMNDFETFVDGTLYSETRDSPHAIFGLDFRYEEGRWQAHAFNPLGEAESPDEGEL